MLQREGLHDEQVKKRVRESQPLSGQAVDIRRPDRGAPITTRVIPSHIIRDHNNKIGLLFCRRKKRRERRARRRLSIPLILIKRGVFWIRIHWGVHLSISVNKAYWRREETLMDYSTLLPGPKMAMSPMLINPLEESYRSV